MTELKDQPTPDAGGAQAAAATADDPLARLHHMSTTAGITSQDYVAINLPAVFATILGFASLLAKLDLLFLIIPLAGVVLGFIALSQIKQSNGTQTGRGFAWGGIILSLLIGGTFTALAGVDRFSAKSDERVMIDKTLELGRKIQAHQYGPAYDMFNDRFKARVKPDAFEAQFKAIEKQAPIRSFDWNGVAPGIEADPGSDTRVGAVYAKVGLGTGGGVTRWSVTFRDAGSGWEIDDLPSVFPPEERGRPRGR